MPDQADPENSGTAGDQGLKPPDSASKGATTNQTRGNRKNRITRCLRRARAGWRTTKFHDRLRVFSEFTGLFVLVAYTIFTALMYCANKEAANAARSAADTAQKTLVQSIESFRIDERAWVEIEPIKPNLLVETTQMFGATFTCDMYPRNEGKTAASGIRIRATDVLSTGGWDKYPDVVRKSQDNIPQEIGDNAAPRVLAPETTAAAPFRLTCEAPKNGGVHYLIGRVDYCDQFRVRHWLRFCYFVVNARGEVWNCQEGNDEDHKPETVPDESCPAE